MVFSMAEVFNNVTVHPPKPPPVILAPNTPSTSKAAFTTISNSGHETS